MTIATIETPKKFNAHFTFTGVHTTDPRLEGLDNETLDRVVTEAVTIKKYEQGEIGFSEVAEILGFEHSSEAMEWLNSKGVNTWRKDPPEIEEEAQKNVAELLDILPNKK